MASRVFAPSSEPTRPDAVSIAENAFKKRIKRKNERKKREKRDNKQRR